jgi:TetR/AcrR family transcriptional regulator
VPDKLHPGPGMASSDVAAHQAARIHRAMIEIVADRGYDRVKVRELVHLASVSSRAFYEHFESKEDCFLRTYDLVVRRATRRIIASQAGEGEWRERPRLIFDAFVKELEGDPDAARLALIGAYAAGPTALEQARKSEATFELMFAESFARAPKGVVVPPMVVEGMTAGVARVARTRMAVGGGTELAHLKDDIMAWILCYPGKPSSELKGLDLQSVWRDTRLLPLNILASSGEGEAWPKTGDRALILTSIAELTAANGYSSLTASDIRRGAGVSRKAYKSHFEGVEDCFVAAMEQRAGEALAQAARAQTAGKTWAGGVYRAISAFCDQISDDSLLRGVCLADNFLPGSSGSRIRTQLIGAVAEQLVDSVPSGEQSTLLATEATTGAIWSLFHHHIVRAIAHSAPQVAATLAFMAIAPVIGASGAVTAIGGEQS